MATERNSLTISITSDKTNDDHYKNKPQTVASPRLPAAQRGGLHLRPDSTYVLPAVSAAVRTDASLRNVRSRHRYRWRCVMQKMRGFHTRPGRMLIMQIPLDRLLLNHKVCAIWPVELSQRIVDHVQHDHLGLVLWCQTGSEEGWPSHNRRACEQILPLFTPLINFSLLPRPWQLLLTHGNSTCCGPSFFSLLPAWLMLLP
jgi:hypothetical protein